MPGFRQMEDRRQDLARAKALLAEAGYPDGFRMQLWCGDATRTYMPRPKDVAIQLQQDFRKIGVEAEITVVEWKRYLPDLSNGRHEACLIGWMADYGDPDNFLYMLLSKETAVEGQANNYAFYEDDVTDGLLRKAREVTDRATRETLYAQAQEKIFADVPVVPLLQMPDMRVVRRSVTGYRIYPAGGEYLGGLDVAK
jgi:peptide/nickel transport system substrate-binding protein